VEFSGRNTILVMLGYRAHSETREKKRDKIAYTCEIR